MEKDLEIKRLKALLVERDAIIAELRQSQVSTVATLPWSVAAGADPLLTGSLELEPSYSDLQQLCLVEGSRMVSMGAWVLDLKQSQVYWSEGVYEIHNVAPATGPLNFDECLSFFVGEDRERVRQAISKLQSDGGSFDLECELRSRTGVSKYVRVVGRCGSELSGCSDCLFGVIQDVTETRQIQDALVEARDQANAANQAKSNFLATVSHELRTPMNPILGFSDLLLDEISDPEHLEMVRSIYEAGQSLYETINSLIEFAELNPEKLKLRQDHFLVKDLLEEVVLSISEVHAPFSIEIEQEQSSDLPEDFMLVGDLDKIKSVLLNLLGNAAKFSGASSAKLHSVVSPMDSQRVLWHVDVEDEGVGIDANLLDHIFAPFRHGSASTRTRVHGGAGIGLAICRGYVELMDGQISVQSRKGEGTTFSFYLSLCRVDRGESAALAGDDSESEKEQLSVLMVEDNASNVFYQTHLLEALDCKLTVAVDGQEALDKFRPNCFDLVLLDLHLPRISGLDVLKSIRESETLAGAPNVPVIVLTADLLRSTETACRDYGADEFIAKPVNANELKLKMAAVLAQT